MISIRTEVKFITIVLSVTMIFNIFVTYYLIQDEKADAQIINVAGKQRMLTQKMIAELHRIDKNKIEAESEFLKAKTEFVKNLERLSKGDLSLAKNEEISASLVKVSQNWDSFELLIGRYLQSNSDPLLQEIYIQGNKTLALVDETVQSYELYATEKRDFINQIQLLLAVFALIVIIYMGRIASDINTQLNKFIKRSSSISGREETEQGSELELACVHIQYFLDDVESAIDSATEAVLQSEKAAMNFQHENHDPHLQKHMDKSEDIVIEANEELYKTSMLLKKLKEKLQVAANPPL